jgi:hypothetical protein
MTQTNAVVPGVERIPFDDIAQNSSVRVATVDGVQYLSIRDIIMVVCVKNGNYANEVWRRVPETFKAEVAGFIVNLKFKGPGQKSQPVIQFQGALKMMMWLPGEQAKKFRSTAVNILTSYYAGDKTLLDEVWANAQAQAPINEAARAALPQLDAIEEYGAKRQKIMEHIEQDLALVKVMAATTKEYNGYLREQLELRRELCGLDRDQTDMRCKLIELEQGQLDHRLNHEQSMLQVAEQRQKGEAEHKRAMKELDSPSVAVPEVVATDMRTKLTVLGVFQKNIAQFAMASGTKARRERLVREAGVKAAGKYREVWGVEPGKALDAGSGFEVCVYPIDAEALLLESLKEAYRHMCAGQNQVPIKGFLVLT